MNMLLKHMPTLYFSLIFDLLVYIQQMRNTTITQVDCNCDIYSCDTNNKS